MNVTGCINISGNINLTFYNRETNQLDLGLINFNCSQNPISDSQLKVIGNYKNSKCDSFKAAFRVQENSLSASITPSLNSLCKSYSLVIGLTVGLVIAVFLIFIIFIIIRRYKKNKIRF